MKQRSVSRHLKVLGIYWNGEGRIIWNTFSWKGQSWKRSTNQSVAIARQTQLLEDFGSVVFTQPHPHLGCVCIATTFQLAREEPQRWRQLKTGNSFLKNVWFENDKVKPISAIYAGYSISTGSWQVYYLTFFQVEKKSRPAAQYI